MKIQDIITADEYSAISKTFTQAEIDWLNNRLQDNQKAVCIKRGKEIDIQPEEVVRQLLTYRLTNKIEDGGYGYDIKNIEFELSATYHGKSQVKNDRIDIAIFNKSKTKESPRLIIEVKRPSIKSEVERNGEESSPLEQMQSYCKDKLAEVGCIFNGGNICKFYLPNEYNEALSETNFPKVDDDIKEWAIKDYTLIELINNDLLQYETLKTVFERVEQRFGANEASDKAFDEIFKLVFTKLYDEKRTSNDAIRIETFKSAGYSLDNIPRKGFHPLKFRALTNQAPEDVYYKINELFREAQKKWEGVFPKDSKLDIQPATCKSCVRELQNVKLFNSNLDVVDEAFEYLVNKNQKDDMGQFFTPRYAIDMCVKMLNPQPEEYVIDTACGSCGFPMHATLHTWKLINPDGQDVFTTEDRTEDETNYVKQNVFGIDFSEKSVRVGRMLNIIAGDGHTNVMYLNTLEYDKWYNFAQNEPWQNKYRKAFNSLKDLSAFKDLPDEKVEKFKNFKFDIILTNPPFAGELNQQDNNFKLYELANGKNKLGRDVLFIERNLNFLKPGGRMAIVLPQGKFNNSSDKYIREYVADKCRILGVVGLHGNVFKAGKNGTGTKTSVLFVQKWTDENCGFPNICPKKPLQTIWHKKTGAQYSWEEYEQYIARIEYRKYELENDTQKEYLISELDYNNLSDGKEKDKYSLISMDERKSWFNIVLDYNIFFATMQKESKDNSGEKIFVKEDYVTVTHYTFENKRIYIRRDNYAQVSEEEYNNDIAIVEYQNKTNAGDVISADAYNALDKDARKPYKLIDRKKLYIVDIKKEKKSETIIDHKEKFIVLEDDGLIDSFKKFILDNVEFKGKNNTISAQDYLLLDVDSRKEYKKVDAVGVNTNPEISLEEYNALSADDKKLYIPSQVVKEEPELIKDSHGHSFVDHDLYNHDPKLNERMAERDPRLKDRYCRDGIFEAFWQFALKEGLSFAKDKKHPRFF